MNALQIIREACDDLGITRPNSVTGSSDIGVRQLLALLNKEGRSLSARHGWQALTREATFVTVATESQGTLTTIIGATNAFRYILNETIFNRTTQLPIMGPSAARMWQAQKALTVTGPYSEYRIRGDTLLFLPAPTAGHTCAFEYVTKNWATSSDGTVQKRAITADEDVMLLDDEIMLEGLKWRWLKAKGLEYGEEFKGYETLVADAKPRDKTARTLDLGRATPGLQPVVVLPPGNWNL